MKLLANIQTRAVIWVWNHSPNCAEMSRLASRDFENPVSQMTRLKMWMHCLICVWCKRYRAQLQFMHRAAPRLTHKFDANCRHALSPAARERILTSLREHLKLP